jgi:hypothetical protein
MRNAPMIIKNRKTKVIITASVLGNLSLSLNSKTIGLPIKETTAAIPMYARTD